jgi:CHORD
VLSNVQTRFPGWKCCKPRVLTFDEFLAIPPCTTGKHSTVDDTPATTKDSETAAPGAGSLFQRSVPKVAPVAVANSRGASQQAVTTAIGPPSSTASPAPPESESDDPSVEISPNATCRRRGCNAAYDPSAPRDEEKCLHHPGLPIFHEGSKGWSCCKRRVLEFDQFMKIPGCREKMRHLFIGKGKPVGEEKIEDVR